MLASSLVFKKPAELLKNFLSASVAAKRLVSSSSSSEKSNKKLSDGEPEGLDSASSTLTVDKSKRLMRLIYARVHPDLFTNSRQAQKENENSLKKLRNLIDSYSALYSASDDGHNSFNSSSTGHEMVFYIRESEDRKKLRKISIKNEYAAPRSSPSIEKRLENVFNQLIDELKIPMRKFKMSQMPASRRSPMNSARVRYPFDFRRGYDDEYVDFDDFEKWSRMNENDTRRPNLKDWLEANKERIDEKQREAGQIKAQLKANKSELIKKWKLNNIIIKSNWSLKNFNSYLLALNNFTPLAGTHFEGFTLVFTNNLPGLRKSGHIHLNCAQVYEEWLNILAVSKKNARLLAEIKEMEDYISRLLKHIKICEPHDNSVNESIISLASFYHSHLNVILNNLTTSIGSIEDMATLVNDPKFANLQLTIQNVSTVGINEAGQFIIGASNRINYHNTIGFIAKNREKSINLYNSFVRTSQALKKLQDHLEGEIKSTISFEPSLTIEQKTTCLEKLKSGLESSKDAEAVNKLAALVQNASLTIGSSYGVNDDGSVDIPWNFVYK